MFLLTKKTGQHHSAVLVETEEKARDLAREWVGEHNEADGYSTKRQEGIGRRSWPVFWTSRHTSFGPRRATVLPISHITSADLLA